MSALDKKKQSVSLLLSRFRGWIQAAATLLTNIHLPNFFKGGIYQGKGKTVCVPGLNCYSCPAASGACPIGAFQAVVGSSKFRFSYYITGILILLGVLFGRFICGFLCPFGWLQELLHKIPGKKLSTKKLRPLTYLKYVILLLAVVLLPALIVNDVGMGDPYFCKYICPLGALLAAVMFFWIGGKKLVLESVNLGARKPSRKREHPRGAGRAVYAQADHFDRGRRFERAVFPPVLQVDLPARRVLRADE